jgi:DNA-binding CsgD family transcriptional regulator
MIRSHGYNRELALRRIKQLSVSGLPVEPYVMALFDLMNDAVPTSPLKAFIISPDKVDAMLCNSAELYAALPRASELFFATDKTTEVGLRFPNTSSSLRAVWAHKPYWRHDEAFLPSFHRTDAFNFATRPLGWWKYVLLRFQEDGEPLGFYPIWRGADQRDYSRDEYLFFETCAPYVAQGLKTAQLIQTRAACEPGDFLPSKLWGTGLVLMDRAGEIVVMDEPARLALGQLAVMDGVGIAALDYRFKKALQYLHGITLATFIEHGDLGRLPTVRMFSHWSGIVMKLRGAMATGSDGREYISVLVERGDSTELRRRRAMARWGLSQREAEVLSFVALGKTNSEIGTILGISAMTAKKHLQNIYASLGVENRTAAAALASENSLDTLPLPDKR